MLVGKFRRVAPTNTRTISPVALTLKQNATSPASQPHGPKPGSIGAIIGQYKSIVTKRINHFRETKNEPIWQRNFHDRIIRDETELNNIRAYIADNPHRWTEDRYHPEITGS